MTLSSFSVQLLPVLIIDYQVMIIRLFLTMVRVSFSSFIIAVWFSLRLCPAACFFKRHRLLYQEFERTDSLCTCSTVQISRELRLRSGTSTKTC